MASHLGCSDRDQRSTQTTAPPSRSAHPIARPASNVPEADDSAREDESVYPVPNRVQRHHAIGTSVSLSPTLQRVLYQQDAFSPLPPPADGDWLAEHAEPGQTFDQYVASRPNRPDEVRSTIVLLPIGALPKQRSPDIEVLADYVRTYFSMPVRVLPERSVAEIGATQRDVEHPDGAQLLSTDILTYLANNLPHDAYALIGLTVRDLYPADSWNFVFGQASLRQRVGVYSFARYHPSFYEYDDGHRHGDRTPEAIRQLILRRSLNVMVHELGHMFGIQHCVYFHCVMNGSNSLDESDRQPSHLCPMDLHKLMHATSLDPVKRYRALQGFYTEHGLSREATFVDRRLRTIAPRSGVPKSHRATGSD